MKFQFYRASKSEDRVDIEINTLEELMELCVKEDYNLIISAPELTWPATICVYNDHVE